MHLDEKELQKGRGPSYTIGPPSCRKLQYNIGKSPSLERRIGVDRVCGFTRGREREREGCRISNLQMEVEGSSKPMIATREEMVEAKVPLAYRDQCAHLLIPLNKCRQSELYLPWKCENERHTYEKCEYELVMERMIQMQKLKQSNKQGQGNTIPLIPKTANA